MNSGNISDIEALIRRVVLGAEEANHMKHGSNRPTKDVIIRVITSLNKNHIKTKSQNEFK